MEKKFSAQFDQEKQRYLSEKTNFASDYRELEKTLQDKLIREKSNLEANFAREKLKLEQTVEELQQIFIDGERGLKGKLKDDFIRLVSEHKSLLESQNNSYENEIKTLRQQTERESKEIKKLKKEIENLEEKHQTKLEEIETR